MLGLDRIRHPASGIGTSLPVEPILTGSTAKCLIMVRDFFTTIATTIGEIEVSPPPATHANFARIAGRKNNNGNGH
jgi:hypothetical protein